MIAKLVWKNYAIDIIQLHDKIGSKYIISIQCAWESQSEGYIYVITHRNHFRQCYIVSCFCIFNISHNLQKFPEDAGYLKERRDIKKELDRNIYIIYHSHC